MNREPDTPRRQPGPTAPEGRQADRDAEPGPHSPPPARSTEKGPESGGYERGQHDTAPTNRKGGYGAG